MKFVYKNAFRIVLSLFASVLLFQSVSAQESFVRKEKPKDPALAEAVIQKAIQNLGGEKYLNVKTQIGRGKFSVIRDNLVVSFQTFTDVIVYPDKERTDFKGSGTRNTQTNVGNTGWVYDGDQDLVSLAHPGSRAGTEAGARRRRDSPLHPSVIDRWRSGHRRGTRFRA